MKSRSEAWKAIAEQGMHLPTEPRTSASLQGANPRVLSSAASVASRADRNFVRNLKRKRRRRCSGPLNLQLEPGHVSSIYHHLSADGGNAQASLSFKPCVIEDKAVDIPIGTVEVTRDYPSSISDAIKRDPLDSRRSAPNDASMYALLRNRLPRAWRTTDGQQQLEYMRFYHMEFAHGRTFPYVVPWHMCCC